MEKIFLRGSILILTFFFVFFGYRISKYEIAGSIVQQNCNTLKHHSINEFLNCPKDTAVLFSKYVTENSFCDITDIRIDIRQLENVLADTNRSKEIIFQVLTDKIYAKDSAKMKIYDLNILAARIQWAEKFESYSQIDSLNRDIFEGVYDYWMSLVSTTLGKYSYESQEIKYSYLYSYLVDRCNERRFSVTVKMSKFEKFIYNLATQKWAHLLDASWNQASLGFKIVFFLIVIISLFGYYTLIEKILKLYGKN
jgi:hypothetical protein